MENPLETAPPPENRASGILLHPTSLPGRGGIGDLGPGARGFLDWLEAAAQGVWQILPFHQTGFGSSPYGAVSSFAGNRLLIDLDDLKELGLAGEGLPEPPAATPHRIDYGAVEIWKDQALRQAWTAFPLRAEAGTRSALEEFTLAESEEGWLPEWALFAALKRRFDGAAWSDWPAELRSRQPAALTAARSDLADEVAYQIFVQFLFFRQWEALRADARRRGIALLGDLPIYPAPDSADVWAHQELFELDGEGRLLACAGVPPDYFSPTGQLWGNPVYSWDRHVDDGFSWWVRRLRFALRHVDQLRLDHFRGFAAYWRVPAEAEDATGGDWVEAPGEALFETVRRELGRLPLVAEDLGVITPDVVALRRRFGLPGMKVLQFAFDEIDSEHLPHHHGVDSVVYTGTHDNDTTRGWYRSLDDTVRHRAAEYLGSDGGQIHWDLIRLALGSVGRLAILPVQDPLGLEDGARMNTPGAAVDNWLWRLEEGGLTAAAAERLRRLTELCGRLPADDEADE